MVNRDENRVDAMTIQSSSRTRVDIQVLRAAAVLAVVFGHFWPDRLPGGFTGVDVFFVISGFLITSQIVSEVQRSSRLNLIAFWTRRIRRIFPAAVSVIAAVVITVLWVGSPDQVDLLARHVSASSLSAENLLLSWDAVDYNHQDDSTSPLQHFWSLAVEEQFYLVWPLLIALGIALTRISKLPIAHFRRILLPAIGVLTIASFAYSTSLDHTNPATYYDPLARAWELGIGAAIAVIGAGATGRIPSLTRQFAGLGAWLVIAGVTFIPGLENAVPGLGVVPSVVATAMVIIAAAPMTSFRLPLVAKTVDGLVWLGDRSYSLYLWHWPVLVMAPFVIGAEMTIVHKVTALALIVVVSALSFRFIEQPFRTSTATLIRRPIFLAAISASLTALLIVGTTVATDSALKGLDAASAANLLPSTTVPTPEIANSDYPTVQPFCDGAGAAVFECAPSTSVIFDARSLPFFPPASPTCDPLDNGNFFDCVLGDVNSSESIAVVGDSHAKALWVAWDDLGKRGGLAVHVFFRDGCPFTEGKHKECGERNRAVHDRLVAGEFDFAIFAQAVDHRRRTPDAEERANFESIYRELAAREVRFVVVKDNPGIGEDQKNCLSYHRRDASRCAMPREEGFAFPDIAFDVARGLELDTIDFSAIYCDDSTCPLVIGGVRVYRDYRHITTIFGKTLGPFLFDELNAFGLSVHNN